MKSIASKMTLVMVLAILLTTSLVVAVSYSLAYQNETAEFELRRKTLIDQLSVILKEPVFVYDRGNIESIVNAYKPDKTIASMIIEDQRGQTLGAYRNNNLEAAYTDTISLEWEGKPIGNVTIGFTTQATDSKLANLLLENFISLVLLVAIISAAVFLGMRYFVTVPMSKLNSILHDIAEGDGDLTARINIDTNDELSLLAGSFNQFISRVQNIISDMMQAESNLLNVTQRIKTITARSAQSSEQQKQLTDTSLQNLKQLSESTTEIARSAEESAANTQSANDVSASSQQKIRQNIEEIGNLVDNLKSTSTVVGELKTAADNIGKVLDVIKSIAEQTNLLALNAAIEAARAGESGRGFAVVADEVRSLASKTHDSTTEIEQIIAHLQNQADVSYQSTQRSTELVSQTIDSANETEISLNQIASQMESVNTMNAQVASATEQQSLVTRDVTSDMERISAGAITLSQDANAMQQATEELLQVEQMLESQIRRFKVA
ncbi:methyl-accepting chemotaxis protein [Alteromonas aestuariivivens]|uniref:Methyl-accepting chemotaxis protein n=1 Tax=Alteromonas aestuariivivens TaxID=1938339 RepID=A0A3D8M9H1_9ALTE|nr:HAMP domain-containing methyl-accepting chemotaxis protein [Alteromonas aestuariivivens]RDV26667.1 methyl-accepting chemotaxis protein [Alteromonas aestuariivivens]